MQFTNWLGVGRSKYYSWVNRQGEENQPNGVQPKRHWLTEKEKVAIVNYYADHRQTGYRRLSYMMLDENVAAVSPSSVYRVLLTTGLLRRTTAKPSKKGTGFHQPKRPHQHWHIDITVRLSSRRSLHQHLWHILLFMRHSGWVQSIHRSLGNPRCDDRS